tara:strand:+ start:1051 stop:1500 length:450 start_codon:yes stop_codon:yes gene_type:complete
MSKVFKIGVTKNNNQKIEEVLKIQLLADKGIIGDRHFHDYNNPYNQLSLIESENIDYYNKKFNLNIPYVNFRRNIITQGVNLNELINKTFVIGNVKVEGVDLCRPCRHLQETLEQKNIIKEFLRKGGLRCRILNSNEIKIGDQIKKILV